MINASCCWINSAMHLATFPILPLSLRPTPTFSRDAHEMDSKKMSETRLRLLNSFQLCACGGRMCVCVRAVMEGLWGLIPQNFLCHFAYKYFIRQGIVVIYICIVFLAHFVCVPLL